MAPEASTPLTSMPPGPRPAPRAILMKSRTVAKPLPFFFQNSTADRISSLETSTQRPRTRTRGSLSLAKARSSPTDSFSLPRAASQSKRTTSSRESPASS